MEPGSGHSRTPLELLDKLGQEGGERVRWSEVRRQTSSTWNKLPAFRYVGSFSIGPR